MLTGSAVLVPSDFLALVTKSSDLPKDLPILEGVAWLRIKTQIQCEQHVSWKVGLAGCFPNSDSPPALIGTVL